jgi:hypothetical protein
LLIDGGGCGSVTTEGIALSRNRAAMLEARSSAAARTAIQPPTSSSGSRSSGRKRRRSIILPAFFVAVMLVAGVAFGAKVMSRNGNAANSLAQSLDALPRSGSVALIVEEHQNIVLMDAASKTLTVASKPTTVNPTQVIASLTTANSSSGTTNTTTVNAPPPDPGTAQSIGYKMLPQFGFNQTTEWTCLLDLWNRESNWLYDAENPSSGAYGIPQALPGDKMASAGADWQTNPATQIKWGLQYITQVYGTPCNAYNFDVANGGY